MIGEPRATVWPHRAKCRALCDFFNTSVLRLYAIHLRLLRLNKSMLKKNVFFCEFLRTSANFRPDSFWQHCRQKDEGEHEGRKDVVVVFFAEEKSEHPAPPLHGPVGPPPGVEEGACPTGSSGRPPGEFRVRSGGRGRVYSPHSTFFSACTFYYQAIYLIFFSFGGGGGYMSYFGVHKTQREFFGATLTINPNVD